MYPIRALGRTLDHNFIEIPIRLISDIHQRTCIPHRLFNTIHVEIYRATSQMIARRTTPYPLIHLRTPEPAIDNNRFHVLRLVVILIISQHISPIILIPEFLKPFADPLQILNGYMTGNITIRSFSHSSWLTQRAKSEALSERH